MWIIHDEQGNIRSSVSGPDKTYSTILDAAGQRYLVVEDSPLNMDITQKYVDIETQTIRDKRLMDIVCDKGVIAADGEDAATVSGIPVGANARIMAMNSTEQEIIVDDGSIEITSDVAATYQVIISAVGYFDFGVEISAQ